VPVVSLFMSVIGVQEIEIGVLLAERRDPPQGRMLRRWLEEHVLHAFADRLLPVDTSVARRSAALHVPNPRPVRDALMAATALVHGLTIVTRNVPDFRGTGVALLNPWHGPGET
jgi:predicted nucleic acid-binding protein